MSEFECLEILSRSGGIDSSGNVDFLRDRRVSKSNSGSSSQSSTTIQDSLAIKSRDVVGLLSTVSAESSTGESRGGNSVITVFSFRGNNVIDL